MSSTIPTHDAYGPYGPANDLLDRLSEVLRANVWVGPYETILAHLKTLRCRRQINPLVIIIQPPGASPSNLLADDTELLSDADLANRFGVDLSALRKRLYRWLLKEVVCTGCLGGKTAPDPKDAAKVVRCPECLGAGRKKISDGGYVEVQEKQAREPKYLYRLGAVRHLIVNCPRARKDDSRPSASFDNTVSVGVVRLES